MQRKFYLLTCRINKVWYFKIEEKYSIISSSIKIVKDLNFILVNEKIVLICKDKLLEYWKLSDKNTYINKSKSHKIGNRIPIRSSKNVTLEFTDFDEKIQSSKNI